MVAHPLIDGVDFALKGSVLHGKLGLETLPRLIELWPDLSGSVAYTIRGLRDGERLLLQIELNGECSLTCQRCLSRMIHPVSMIQVLRLAPPEKIDLIDREDELECIEASTEMDVIAMIEDELLLGLPYAPRHPEGECAGQLDGSKRIAGPFAELANLDIKRQ